MGPKVDYELNMIGIVHPEANLLVLGTNGNTVIFNKIGWL